MRPVIKTHGLIVVIVTIFFVAVFFSWSFLTKSTSKKTEEYLDYKFEEQIKHISNLLGNTEFILDLQDLDNYLK